MLILLQLKIRRHTEEIFGILVLVALLIMACLFSFKQVRMTFIGHVHLKLHLSSI